VFSGPTNPENLPEDGKLKSEVMVKDNRRYYLDLKENQRGRFLRVSVQVTCQPNYFIILFIYSFCSFSLLIPFWIGMFCGNPS
jgi:hypothetical protein